MKVKNYDYIMIFTSHHRALYIYDRLARKNIKTKLVNAPNKISISCTQALKFDETDMEVIKIELQKNNIYPTSVYKIVGEGKNETYELVE
jgi:hypothetical protein